MQHIVSILKSHAREVPEKILFNYLGNGNAIEDSLTFAELDSQAKLLASYLLEFAEPENVAILFYKPGLHFVRAFFACLYAKIIPVPLPTPRPNRSLTKYQYIFKNAQPKLILTDMGLSSTLFDQLNTKDIKQVNTTNLFLSKQSTLPDITLDDVAFIQYTSGSTQLPKGVVISHRNIIANSNIIKESFGTGQNSNGIIWLPSYHDMGLIGGIIQPIYTGFCCKLMSPLNFFKRPINWLKAISSVKNVVSGGHSNAYQHCIESIKLADLENNQIDLSGWDVAFCGSEKIPASLVKTFCEKFAPFGFHPDSFLPCYGLAESTLFVTCKTKSKPTKIVSLDKAMLQKNKFILTDLEKNSQPIVSCGIPCGDTKIFIKDFSTNKSITSEDRIGEIIVSGESVSRGYWNNTDNTNQSFSKKFNKLTLKTNYLHTGDLGFIHKGELYILGRIKEMIIIDGQNYYPQDIEFIIYSQVAETYDIGNIVAFSSDKNDLFEHLVLFVEINKQIMKNKLELKNLRRQILNVLINNFDISTKSIIFCLKGSVPLTSSGKLQRNFCKKIYDTDVNQSVVLNEIIMLTEL